MVVSPLVPPLQVLPTVVHTGVPPAWLPAPATQLPDNFFYTTTNIATTYRQLAPAAVNIIDYTLHDGSLMDPSPKMVLCSHHYPDTMLIEHTLKQPTTPYGDILTCTYAPLITIDHSRLLIAKLLLICLDYSD